MWYQKIKALKDFKIPQNKLKRIVVHYPVFLYLYYFLNYSHQNKYKKIFFVATIYMHTYTIQNRKNKKIISMINKNSRWVSLSLRLSILKNVVVV